MPKNNPHNALFVKTFSIRSEAKAFIQNFLPKWIRACWEFVFGDKKDVFFGLMMSNFTIIAVALLVKFEEIRTKKTLF